MSAPAQCRSCKAPIVWAQTEAGKRIPVDEAPVADGNLALIGTGPGGTTLAAIYDPAKHAGKTRFVSHFSTCPHAGAWRRR